MYTELFTDISVCLRLVTCLRLNVEVHADIAACVQLVKCSRPNIEVCTVDRYQGRDKECIIISFVRNNAEQRIGDLLSDWRRINVAITRARSKIIFIGSAATLQGNALLASLVQHARDLGRFLTLTEFALVQGCPQWATIEGWALFRKVKQQRRETEALVEGAGGEGATLGQECA